MKRKLCSVLLALCMVLTLLPVSALADDGTALPNADGNGVVTLTENVTIEKWEVTQNATLNLNGFTYTTSDCGIDISNGATLTIVDTGENGKLTSSGTPIRVTGTSSKVVINSGVIESTGDYGIYAKDGGTATVNGGTVHSKYAALSGNNTTGNMNFEINGGTLTSDNGPAIYMPGQVTLKITAGTLNGGISLRMGQVTISGGTINATTNTATIDAPTSTVAGKPAYAYSGNVWFADALYVFGGTYENGDAEHGNSLNLTITGGTFNCANDQGSAVAIYDLGKVAQTANVTITGGTFTTAATTRNAYQVVSLADIGVTNPESGYGNSEFVGKVNSTISNGTFSDLSALNYLAPSANVSVKLATNVDKTVSIPAGATVALDLKGHDIAVTSGCAIVNKGNLTVTGSGKVSTTASESAAVANFPGATATLKGGDYTSDVWYIIKNLGEMLIDGPVSIAKPADNTNTASLIDNGWVNSSDTVASESVAAQAGKASLTIKSGNFNGSSGAKSCSVVKNDDYGTLNISGGTFDSTNNKGADNAATILNRNVATISGGTFTGLYPLSNGAYTGEADKGLLTVTGGNFVGTRTIFGNGIGGNGKGAVTISGGTFTAPALGAIYDNVEGGYTVSLTGGTYSVDPSAYVVPGYVASYNGSTYTVYYPVPVTPGNTSSSTTKNPDGSTTTTTTDKTTGTVTETTKNPDGSTTTVETRKDGSVTETNKTAGGSVGTVKSDANGNSEISASISAADVSAAAKKNEPVAAPVSVAPAASPAAAPVIKLSVPASAGEVSVVIPVTNAQQGTVAIKVNPDGTEEIIKTSVVTKDGVVLGVKGSAQIKIVNNDKDFADTVGHWAESDVDFVSARELFTGTAPQTFSPEAATTRGMVVTVLARLAGESTDGGANWYDKGCAWAVTNGVSDGTDPNGTVTREQLAAMLYRYFGSPAVSGSLSFADASSVSEYAHDAMQWCVNNGIINGMDGLLNPQGQATRAQVSAMFARYIHLAATK